MPFYFATNIIIRMVFCRSRVQTAHSVYSRTAKFDKLAASEKLEFAYFFDID